MTRKLTRRLFVVNIAGGTNRSAFVESTREYDAEIIRLNYGYILDSTRRMVPLIRKSGKGGAIVNFTTIEAHRGAEDPGDIGEGGVLRGFGAGRDPHARRDVLGDDRHGNLTQRRRHGVDLLDLVQAVAVLFDHRPQPVLPGLRHESRLVDRFQGPLPERRPVADVAVHMDEPLRRVAENHRLLGAP